MTIVSTNIIPSHPVLSTQLTLSLSLCRENKTMAPLFSLYHFTPLLLLLFILSSIPTFILAVNITALLSSFPDLSDFNSLLTSSSVTSDLSQRSSLTLLAVPNSFLRSDPSLHLCRSSSPANLADILRYHVLLQYLSWPDLRLIPPSGKLFTTLYQTTGRAPSNLGDVNLTRNPLDASISVRSPVPYSSLNVTLLSLVKSLPYNVSIFSVNSLLVPYGFDLLASENRPPLGLNITRVLLDGHNFNVAASMLTASGVVEEFEADETGAGITVFVPTDDAFADLPTTERLQSLPADRKAVVLKFHVLHSYYPLGSLESIVNPVQPTLATEEKGAGTFTLNITRVNGSIAIDTGIVQASITQTVFDQNPLAVFAVSRVLLPREIFGKEAATVTRSSSNNSRGVAGGGAPAPDNAFSPESSRGMESPATHLSSPPRFREAIKSSATVAAAAINGGSSGIALICIALLYLLV